MDIRGVFSQSPSWHYKNGYKMCTVTAAEVSQRMFCKTAGQNKVYGLEQELSAK